VGDISIPDTRASAVSWDAIRGVARSWWLFLVLGILWILFGMFVLSYNVGSLLALAVFAGVTCVMTGITQVLAAGRVDSSRWLHLLGGSLSLLAGFVAFIWPGATLLVLSVILAWFLVFKGIVDTVGALASIGRPWWWVTLILGILELLLGICRLAVAECEGPVRLQRRVGRVVDAGYRSRTERRSRRRPRIPRSR
jgi:uncharacterized membrane protein HdeD (DUF308 family)